MSRYIDAEILLDAMRYLTLGETDVARSEMKIVHYICHMPYIADVQDNATAHMVVGGGERDGSTCWFECDNCGLAVGIGDVFCKHCGARFIP